jgi:alpha-L-rhamnosidase
MRVSVLFQSLLILCLAVQAQAQQPRPAIETTPIKPKLVEKRGDIYFADFAADAYGNLQITFADSPPAATLTIRLGERLDDKGALDRKPQGSVNYCETTLAIEPATRTYKLQIPTKRAHRAASAVKMPADIGEVTPFRYVEIENCPVALDKDENSLRQLAVHTAFDDSASSFHSSDETLNAVWDLCKHTMQATTAFGVYFDGERERCPYEADAYINMRSHLACDFNPEVARYSIEYLLQHKTWPIEWSFHMPMMAEADYETTGDFSLAARNYDELKKKLLIDKARDDGLLRAKAIIDWPAPERDGFDGNLEVNLPVNAFYYHALKQMALVAKALKNAADAADFDAKAANIEKQINDKFFDPATGLYIDGEGSTHSSLHANMFPLAFDLVPADRRQKVLDFVQSRGMACSVYGSQYLLEALYKNGRDDYALSLLTSRGDRGWQHMLDLGSTMTLEAWDRKFKPNLTWNHAWGAAPANIISRYLLGVRPETPGYEKIKIAPRPGSLKSAQAKVPTPKGPVTVNFQNDSHFTLEIDLPKSTTARVSLPLKSTASDAKPQVTMDGKPIEATPEPGALSIENVPAGRHTFEVK